MLRAGITAEWLDKEIWRKIIAFKDQTMDSTPEDAQSIQCPFLLTKRSIQHSLI